jgi:hypothetical protein
MEFGCKVAGSKCCVVLGHVELLRGACDHVEMGHLTLTKIQPAVYDEKRN